MIALTHLVRDENGPVLFDYERAAILEDGTFVHAYKIRRLCFAWRYIYYIVATSGANSYSAVYMTR